MKHGMIHFANAACMALVAPASFAGTRTSGTA